MTGAEQLWLAVIIGGFILFLNGAISRIVRCIAGKFKKEIPEDYVKLIIGSVMIIWAVCEIIPIT